MLACIRARECCAVWAVSLWSGSECSRVAIESVDFVGVSTVEQQTAMLLSQEADRPKQVARSLYMRQWTIKYDE